MKINAYILSTSKCESNLKDKLTQRDNFYSFFSLFSFHAKDNYKNSICPLERGYLRSIPYRSLKVNQTRLLVFCIHPSATSEGLSGG